MTQTVDLGQRALNKQELKVIELLLYQIADLINALMVDGVPYTKVKIGGQ